MNLPNSYGFLATFFKLPQVEVKIKSHETHKKAPQCSNHYKTWVINIYNIKISKSIWTRYAILHQIEPFGHMLEASAILKNRIWIFLGCKCLSRTLHQPLRPIQGRILETQMAEYSKLNLSWDFTAGKKLVYKQIWYFSIPWNPCNVRNI